MLTHLGYIMLDGLDFSPSCAVLGRVNPALCDLTTSPNFHGCYKIFQCHYSTLANWTMASSFPMLGTLFVPDFLFGRPFGLIRTETPIDALAGNTGFEPVQT